MGRNSVKIQTHLKNATAPLALSIALVAQPAFAQDESEAPGEATDVSIEDTGEVIIVTGSRIQLRSVDTREPTLVLSSEEIEQRAFNNIGDALETIPAFAPPSSNPVGGQAGSFGAGQTFINFFGLGSQRTLTLVNGRRYVSSNTASIFGPVAAGSQVDLNTIPTLMVDRLETIAVGGAPIYGSDAIAGTVNIILKNNFDGLQLHAQNGISGQGDAHEYRLAALAGTSFADGRGQIVASIEYNNSEGLLYTDREQTARGLFYASPADPDFPYANQLIEDRRIPILSEFGAPTIDDIVPGLGSDFLDVNGNTLVFNAQGQLVPLDFGTPTGSLTNAAGGTGFSLTPLSNLQSPTERILGYARASYEITPAIEAFAEFSYANSKGTELRAQPVYNTWLFGDAGDPDGNLIIPLSNPFLSDEARATIASQLPAGQDFFYLGRANTDLISGRGSTEVELYRIVAGFTGDFELGDRDFAWSLVGNYGRSKTTGSSRELVQQNFENALTGCTGDSSPIATVSSTCSPFNPFGHQNSQAVADYITTIANPIADNRQWVVTADITGDLFDIWGGEVGFAIGYEHREERAEFDPGEFFYGIPDPSDPNGSRGQYGRSIPIDPVTGEFNTDEVFGELLIPLVSPDMGIPLIDTLEINGAARYVDHSLAGGDLTWTAGGRWKPIEDFGIRGNFTRSIRSPAITELFNPNSRIFTTAQDPCDSRYIDQGPNPANRAANCAAAGLPANFVSNIVDFTSEGSRSGNPALGNEKANSWTVGLFVTPRFIPNLTLTADWVDISLENAIISANATQTMEACYDAVDFPSEACGQIDRDAAGQVSFIRTGYLNAASYEYRGLIAGLNWRVDTPFLGAESRITINGSYQYNDKLEQRIGTGDLTTLRGGIGYSKHKATGSVSYTNGAFGAFLQGQYIGEAVVDPDASPDVYEYFTRDDVMFVNAAISYKVADRARLQFNVDNLFDTKAPFPTPAGANSLVTYYDGVLGRYFKIGATIDF